MNSIDLGGERGVANGVAESDAESDHGATFHAGLGHHGERHREAAERTDQQQKRQLSTGRFDHRCVPIDPKHRADERGQCHTCERNAIPSSLVIGSDRRRGDGLGRRTEITGNGYRHRDDRPRIRVVDELFGDRFAARPVPRRNRARLALFASQLVHLVPIETAALTPPAARVLFASHHDSIRAARPGTRRRRKVAGSFLSKPQLVPIQPQHRLPVFVHCVQPRTRLSVYSSLSPSLSPFDSTRGFAEKIEREREGGGETESSLTRVIADDRPVIETVCLALIIQDGVSRRSVDRIHEFERVASFV